MLTTKQAELKIMMFYRKTFEKYEDFIEWFPNVETNETYSWVFEINGKRIRIECDKKYGTINLF